MFEPILNSLYNNSLYNIILLIILFITFLVELFYYLYFYTGVIIENGKTKKNEEQNEEKPSVSVIICAKNEEENLQNFLPLILEQNYPNYEVIVVNDGSWDDSEELLFNLQKLYPHLYYTSIPQNSRVICHKKLAITVGIKAAKNDLLLFTDADCRPLTPHWITEMTSNYSEKIEYVISYGGYYYNNNILSTLISYDTLFIAMQYFGFAHRGLPYMGVGRNMSYRKKTFIERKGFAGFLHIQSGDDDLLINNFGNKNNVVIECRQTAKTLSIPEKSFKDWCHQKKRHFGTIEAYTSKSKTLISIEPIARGLMYLSALLLLIQANINIANIIIITILFFIKYTTLLLVVNKTATHLKETWFGISAILLDIILPIITLILMISRKFTKKTKRNVW